MKVLVTGSSGVVGRYSVAALQAAGHAVAPFDLVDGHDVRDPDAVATATRDVDAVLHLAAIGVSAKARAPQLVRTNVDGTRTVLAAAARAGVGRFVYASSVNALGIFLGLRAPDRLPIDDDHPCYATSPYGTTKLLGEELCAVATESTGMSTICLRIPSVMEPDHYSEARAEESERGIWEYGFFIDARDLGDVIVRAMEAPSVGHQRVLVGSGDAMRTTIPPIEIADRRYPDVPWTDRAGFEATPSRPLVRIDRARELLAWTPVHTWSENVASASRRQRRERPARALRRVRRVWRRDP